jgi:hypothetical protein
MKKLFVLLLFCTCGAFSQEIFPASTVPVDTLFKAALNPDSSIVARYSVPWTHFVFTQMTAVVDTPMKFDVDFLAMDNMTAPDSATFANSRVFGKVTFAVTDFVTADSQAIYYAPKTFDPIIWQSFTNSGYMSVRVVNRDTTAKPVDKKILLMFGGRSTW